MWNKNNSATPTKRKQTDDNSCLDEMKRKAKKNANRR